MRKDSNHIALGIFKNDILGNSNRDFFLGLMKPEGRIVENVLG